MCPGSVCVPSGHCIQAGAAGWSRQSPAPARPGQASVTRPLAELDLLSPKSCIALIHGRSILLSIKQGWQSHFSRMEAEGLPPLGVRGQGAARTGPPGHVTKSSLISFVSLIQTSCDGSDLVHSQLFPRWRAAGAGHVAHRRPQLFAHVFTFWAKSLKSFLKPVTPHLHQVIPFSLSLFLVHAGHLDESHRGWCGRGRGLNTCWRRQSPPSWFPAAGHTSRPCAAGAGRGGHVAS